MPAVRKCVIWDLDNTVWDGVCLEGEVRPRPEVRTVLTVLRERGLLHSIASRGESSVALAALERYGLREFFIHPKINWLAKSTNVREIARELNIGLDSIAFVDDDPFERAQAAFMLPDILVVDARDAASLPEQPAFSPGEITAESAARSRMYAEEQKRRDSEAAFADREEFLRSCDMRLVVRPMSEMDLPRVRELMTRTHQLNTTGVQLSEDELQEVLRNPASSRRVHVAELRDRFGWCGIIGAALSEEEGPRLDLRLFALSCRVMGRGIERAFLAVLVHEARARGCTQLRGLLRETGRNRMMRALYQMNGFRLESDDDRTLVFSLAPDANPTVPHWVHVS